MPKRNQKIAATPFIAIDSRSIHHHNIEFSVIVAIEETHAPAHGLNDVIFFT